MCGVFGIYNFKKDLILNESISQNKKHRGPDNFGFHKEDNFILGNNRLSIIDLNSGNQPFYSLDKKIIVIQNGEIYNYKFLQKN